MAAKPPPRKRRHIEGSPDPSEIADTNTNPIVSDAEENTTSDQSNNVESLRVDNTRTEEPQTSKQEDPVNAKHESPHLIPPIKESPTQKTSATQDRRVSFAPPPTTQVPDASFQQPSEKERRPRLVITKMVLNNFKSYAGRQVIGPFHKSFSAIVGPNGSGKSNVIDALLFVFGYRANKMRQGKLSELIHNSAKFPNCESCSVEVHFQEIIDGDGPNSFEPVPNSTLKIARQAYRGNSSRYYINNKTSSFAEVTTLLRDRGIDLDHKRFLILQGEVESIALMKAKAKDENDDGLLEYLEDIIGTSKYKEPIESANERLETLNEERLEKLNRVKYVKKERDSLEGKKREAETYLENENDLARRKNELYQIYISEANANIEIADKAVEELKIKLKDDAEKQVDLEKEIAVMDKDHQSTVKDYEAIEAETDKLMKQYTKYERADVELRERKQHLSNKLEKAKTSIETDRNAKQEALEAIKTNQEELTSRKKELEGVEKQLKQEEKKLDEINQELKGKTDGYLAQIEAHQKELAPWTEKINGKKKDIDVKQSESEILAERISSGQRAVEEAEKRLAAIRETHKKKVAESEPLPADIEKLKSELAEIEEKIKNVEEAESSHRTQLNLARQKADEAKMSMQQSQNRGKVLASLLRMRDSGRIKGIYDRLGNLGVIDDKYDVAISTACPALDNIVVDTVEAGQACIEYLRKNNLGRGVFTILNQQNHQDMRPIETPENVPRLFDLVKPKDKRFLPAFYSVLKDTVVADNMKQANRIAFGEKRWRVVTLDGKLIEKSGAMTGGGNRPIRGAMDSRFKGEEVSAETVARLEKERDKLEAGLQDIIQERRAAELALRSTKDMLPRKEVTLEKLQMDIRSLEKQVGDENKRLEELNAQTKPRPEDIQRHEEIKKEIEQLSAEMQELKEKTGEIEENIRSLHEDIMNAGGMDLRLQKIVVDDVRKKIDNLNKKITKCMVAKAKAEKDVTKLEISVKKNEKEIEKIEADLKEVEQEFNTKSKEAAQIMQEADKLKENMKAKKQAMEELKKELDEKRANINKLRTSKVNIENQLTDYQRNLVDNQKKVSHWKEQRSKLFLQKIKDETPEELELPNFDDEALDELQASKQIIKGEIAELEAYVQTAKPNLSVLEEYRRREIEYKERYKDLEEVTAKRDEVKTEVETLRKQRLDEFMYGFNIISQKLKEMYQMITMGGNAELELVDSLDPFSEGIVFSVMPPKKSWKNISNLSGGEKTLSSLALVFALHHFKPTPLYVMDEIDAALDFRNVSIVANYIAERTKDAQFVIISLRNNMFELADRLVGIYKTMDCTKSIAINPAMIAMLSLSTNEDTTTTATEPEPEPKHESKRETEPSSTQ
ncbi:hypothetical protein EC973_001396 [Apophysomyces ossiformis]|uniref:Structural maintenance of chromosomes protein n=1 Tax=Apophysomyces ossiformis TaxID=679940 RepID=A0A8H7ENL0_9FUNG|nr:hypothetical protein EC973_001396 [Apophysomyces ossiformis]